MSKHTAKEIIEIMERAKELGVNKFKGGGVEVQFSAPEPIKQEPLPIADEPTKDFVAPMSVLDDYSDEEIKYFATPYFDELMAKKQARTEELKTEEKPNV